MYTVIGHPRSRTMRVMWMLEEIGAAYEVVPAAPGTPEAKAHSPSGKIPALVDDGHALLDSVAICTYLGDKHHKLTFPAGTYERAVQDSYTQFCVDEVEGALWTCSKHGFVLPEEQRVEAVKESCHYEFDRAMAALEKRLGDRTFVMGDTFTVPDLLLGHCAGWAKNGPKWDLPGGAVGAYFERVRARPALARAMEKGAAALAA